MRYLNKNSEAFIAVVTYFFLFLLEMCNARKTTVLILGVGSCC